MRPTISLFVFLAMLPFAAQAQAQGSGDRFKTRADFRLVAGLVGLNIRQSCSEPALNLRPISRTITYLKNRGLARDAFAIRQGNLRILMAVQKCVQHVLESRLGADFKLSQMSSDEAHYLKGALTRIKNDHEIYRKTLAGSAALIQVIETIEKSSKFAAAQGDSQTLAEFSSVRIAEFEGELNSIQRASAPTSSPSLEVGTVGAR